MTGERLERLQAATGEAGLDAVAVMPGPNMVYLTGLRFHLSERAVLAVIPGRGEPTMIVPALEESKARDAGEEWRIHSYDDVAGPRRAFAALAQEVTGDRWRLGVEARRIRFLELRLLAESGHEPDCAAADAVFASLRMRKDAAELDAMRRAAKLAEAALEATLPQVQAGVTERQVAAELTVQLLKHGSEPELPFMPLVASGPNGANPHGFPTERPLQGGDLVTIDWGANVDGYFSDITRTYVVDGNEPESGLVQAYDVVRAANAAGRGAAKPGGTGEEVDRAARQVIEASGLGQYFIHRTGHGLGLEGHEEPDMKEGSTTPLEVGMTFTVEPGVYLPGLGGIRIEDDVVITEDGAESLTTLSRELIAIGQVVG